MLIKCTAQPNTLLGSYTVRTESTVRTTELNFMLGIPFKEETLDGRVTNTIATRVGNVLTLDQQGMVLTSKMQQPVNIDIFKVIHPKVN